MQEVPKINTETWVQKTFQSINFPTDNFWKEKQNSFSEEKVVDKNDSVVVLDDAENRECDKLKITKDNQGVNV